MALMKALSFGVDDIKRTLDAMSWVKARRFPFVFYFYLMLF
jgi:hypothetical protein